MDPSNNVPARIPGDKPADKGTLFSGNSFQHLAYAYTEHVLTLAAEGTFDGALDEHGKTISSSNLILVMVYFAHHTARNTDLDKGRLAGCVLEGKATQKAIMRETGLSEKTVQRAIKWLSQHGFIHVTYIHEGKKQYYGSIEITSWCAQNEAQRKEWWTDRKSVSAAAEQIANQSQEPVVPVTVTGSTSHSDPVFNTSSYTKEETPKSESVDPGPSAGDKRMKPAAHLDQDDQPLEVDDTWLESFKARMVPDLDQPAEPDGMVTFFVGKSKSGAKYLAMEGSRSDKHPAGREFVPGMDEGQIRLTPEQVTEYFKAKQTDNWRWRDLNNHYYRLAMDTDPGFRQRPAKRTLTERAREYNNNFWVLAEGDHAGYFTRRSQRDREPGEVEVSLTPQEAKKLFSLGSHPQQVGFMKNKLPHYEYEEAI